MEIFDEYDEKQKRNTGIKIFLKSSIKDLNKRREEIKKIINNILGIESKVEDEKELAA